MGRPKLSSDRRILTQGSNPSYDEAVTRGDLLRGKARARRIAVPIRQASNAVHGANIPLPLRGGTIAGDPGRRSRSPWCRHAFAAAPAGSSRSDAITTAP